MSDPMMIIFTIRQALPPLEAAITFGAALFALSWVVPRRIVSLPPSGRRGATLVWAGVAGSVFVVAVATAVSWIAASSQDVSGFDGWWRRPAPLVAAAIVVAVAGIALRAVPLPAPGERAIAPRRPWNAFAPRTLVWITGILAGVLALTALWQIAIATTAPEDGTFIGNVPEHTDLPIYMPFNSGFGYIGGVGWPNQLAMLIALACAGAAFVVALRADANRPMLARSSASSIRVERELTARMFTLILFGGLVTTLGAEWMHAGSIGQATVGLDQEWIAEDVSTTRVYVGSGYDAFARPMNLLGYFLQAAGVAFLLRLAVDTARAARAAGRARVASSGIDPVGQDAPVGTAR